MYNIMYKVMARFKQISKESVFVSCVCDFQNARNADFVTGNMVLYNTFHRSYFQSFL